MILLIFSNMGEALCAFVCKRKGCDDETGERDRQTTDRRLRGNTHVCMRFEIVKNINVCARTCTRPYGRPNFVLENFSFFQ